MRVPLRVRAAFGRHVMVEHGAGRFNIPLRYDHEGFRWWAQWQPSWKTEVLRALLSDRDGLFVDAGANMGQTLLDHLYIRHAGEYLGFEPLPECVAFLQQVIRSNQLSGCQVVPVALADRAGLLPIYVRPEVQGDDQATLLPGLRPGVELVARHVPCAPLDDIWQRLGGPDIAAIKIDVEGGELLALRGMLDVLRDKHPPILCEVLYRDRLADLGQYEDRVEELWDVLRCAGYTVSRIVKPAGTWTGTETVSRFPIRTWTAGDAEACDYLFLPGGMTVAPSPPKS